MDQVPVGVVRTGGVTAWIEVAVESRHIACLIVPCPEAPTVGVAGGDSLHMDTAVSNPGHPVEHEDGELLGMGGEVVRRVVHVDGISACSSSQINHPSPV